MGKSTKWTARLVAALHEAIRTNRSTVGDVLQKLKTADATEAQKFLDAVRADRQALLPFTDEVLSRQWHTYLMWTVDMLDDVVAVQSDEPPVRGRRAWDVLPVASWHMPFVKIDNDVLTQLCREAGMNVPSKKTGSTQDAAAGIWPRCFDIRRVETATHQFGLTTSTRVGHAVWRGVSEHRRRGSQRGHAASESRERQE